MTPEQLSDDDCLACLRWQGSHKSKFFFVLFFFPDRQHVPVLWYCFPCSPLITCLSIYPFIYLRVSVYHICLDWMSSLACSCCCGLLLLLFFFVYSSLPRPPSLSHYLCFPPALYIYNFLLSHAQYISQIMTLFITLSISLTVCLYIISLYLFNFIKTTIFQGIWFQTISISL